MAIHRYPPRSITFQPLRAREGHGDRDRCPRAARISGSDCIEAVVDVEDDHALTRAALRRPRGSVEFYPDFAKRHIVGTPSGDDGVPTWSVPCSGGLPQDWGHGCGVVQLPARDRHDKVVRLVVRQRQPKSIDAVER